MNEYYPQQTDEDEIEVELAGGWERIGAALLNNIFTMIAAIPMFGGMVAAVIQGREKFNVENNNFESLNSEQQLEIFGSIFSNTWFLLGLVVLLVYAIAQCYYMSRHGQSFGKKLLNLKVIKQNGDDAGFVGVVLLREIVFNLGCAVILGVLGALLAFGDMVQQLLGYIPTLICAVMLFAAADKRTLQDWIAGTVVVKLPRVRKVRRRVAQR
ncbi:RDD family protein [Neisseriaceae bacterium B1]